MSNQAIVDLEQWRGGRDGCVCTIGNFDGVHRGHQRLLSIARDLARPLGVPVVAVTFEPPPAKVVAPDRAPALLMQPAQKHRALLAAGADRILVLRSSPELFQMDPETFVRDVLAGRLGPRHVVEGASFTFGRDRVGTPETLRELGTRYGFEVHVPAYAQARLADGQPVAVSSSLIRRLVKEGRMDDAAACLGRPYALLGPVVHGDGRGRTLDYPTANLDVGEQLLPRDGVYAGLARLGDDDVAAAVSIGTKPTFGSGPETVEAYLLNWRGDLYGRPLELALTHYIRGQQRFDSAEALRYQMDRDVERVRELLAQR